MKPARVYPELYRSGFALIIVVATIALAIGAVAVFAYQKYTVSHQDQTKDEIPLSSPSTNNIDPTANWKTYTNKKYQITFKYPSEFFIAEDNSVNYVSFFLSEDEKNKFVKDCFSGNNHTGCISDDLNIGFDIFQKPKNKTLEEFIRSRPHNDPDFKSLSPTKIDNFPGMQMRNISGSEGNYNFYLDRNKDIFYLYASSFKNPQKNLQTFDQILSTFKFTEETANWRTYTNPQNTFSLKLPPGWAMKSTQSDPTFRKFTFEGSEGSVEILYGSGLGGGCQKWSKIEIANGSINACLTPNAIGATTNFQNQGFSISAKINIPTPDNELIIRKIYSTINLIGTEKF